MTLIGAFHPLRDANDLRDTSLEVFDDRIVLDGRTLPLERIDALSVRTRPSSPSGEQGELVVNLVGSPEIVVPLPSEEAAEASAVIEELLAQRFVRSSVAPEAVDPWNGSSSESGSGPARDDELGPATIPYELARWMYREPLSRRLMPFEDTILKVLTGLALAALLLIVVASTRHSSNVALVTVHAPLPSPHANVLAFPSTAPPSRLATPSVRPTPRLAAAPKQTHKAHPRPTDHRTKSLPAATKSAPTVAPPAPVPSPRPSPHPSPPSAKPSPSPQPKPSVSVSKPAPSPSIKPSPPPPPKPSVSISNPAPSPSISIGTVAQSLTGSRPARERAATSSPTG